MRGKKTDHEKAGKLHTLTFLLDQLKKISELPKNYTKMLLKLSICNLQIS